MHVIEDTVNNNVSGRTTAPWCETPVSWRHARCIEASRAYPQSLTRIKKGHNEKDTTASITFLEISETF